MKYLVLVAILLSLTACSDGSVRYDCQKFENWKKPACNPPKCYAEGECVQDLFTEEQWQEIKKVIEQ